MAAAISQNDVKSMGCGLALFGRALSRAAALICIGVSHTLNLLRSPTACRLRVQPSRLAFRCSQPAHIPKQSYRTASQVLHARRYSGRAPAIINAFRPSLAAAVPLRSTPPCSSPCDTPAGSLGQALFCPLLIAPPLRDSSASRPQTAPHAIAAHARRPHCSTTAWLLGDRHRQTTNPPV